MKLKQPIRILGITALLGLSSTQAMAYQLLQDCNGTTERWSGSGFTFNANPTGFGGTYAKWRTSFATALTRFNDTPTRFNVSVRLDNDTSVGIGNGESEIWWASGTSAVAYNTTNPCGRIIEGDIVFHNNIPNGGYGDNMGQKTDFRGYGLEKRTFESTALHEVGHTVGLAHENRYYNIMGTDYTHLHTTGENSLRSYMGEDAVNGLISLYGSNTRQDLSVAAWRRVGSSGQYSSHGRTRLLSSSGSVLNSSKVESSCTRDYCEMRHNVALGQQIQYEMTLENNGSHSQTVQLGYYISTNASITNQDTLIGTDMVTVTRNTPDTVIKNVTIPANLQPDTNYYLGVIIDNGGAVNEWTEANNSSYTHIRTGTGTTDPGTGNLENACSTEGPTTSSSLTSGDAICVPDGSSANSIQYYYVYVPSGTNSIKIESDHGTGDGDVYYKASTWATSSNYDQSSTNGANQEQVTVTNPATGYRFISVVGQRAGMTLKVTLE